MRREAALQAQIGDADPGDPAWEEAISRHAKAIRAYLDRPLTDTALWQRAMYGQGLIARVGELEAVLRRPRRSCAAATASCTR